MILNHVLSSGDSGNKRNVTVGLLHARESEHVRIIRGQFSEKLKHAQIKC